MLGPASAETQAKGRGREAAERDGEV